MYELEFAFRHFTDLPQASFGLMEHNEIEQSEMK
jgi:hypothetical protein